MSNEFIGESLDDITANPARGPYEYVSSALPDLIKRQFGIELDRKKFIIFFRAISFFDQKIDEGELPIEDALREMCNPQIIIFGQLIEQADSRTEFRQAITSILEENEKQKNPPPNFSYEQSRKEEGASTADALFYFVENEFPDEQKATIQKFLQEIGGGGNLFDTLVDLKQDGRLNLKNFSKALSYLCFTFYEIYKATPKKLDLSITFANLLRAVIRSRIKSHFLG